jgi:hypothetical protein
VHGGREEGEKKKKKEREREERYLKRCRSGME